MKKVLLLANIAVALVLALLITRSSISDREQTIESAYQNLEFVTAAMAEHAQQTLAALDLAVGALEFQAAENGLNNTDLLHQVAVGRQTASVNTYAFYILDQNGRLQVTSRTENPDPVDLSGMAEFTVHRDGEHDGLYIAVPRIGMVGDAEGNWVINVSRRIQSPEGEFAGIAAASMSMDHLLNFYNTLRPAQQSAVGVLSARGQVIARSPFEPELMGMDISASSQFRTVLDRVDGGRVLDITADEGLRRLSSFRYTWNEQLITYANITEDEVLADWRGRTASKILIGLLVVLMFAGASVTAGFLVRRQQQFAAQTLRTQQEALAQVNAAKAEIERIFDSISDAVFSLDTEWRFEFLNAEAERVLERPASQLLGKIIWKEFPELEETGFYGRYKVARESMQPINMERYYRPLKKWFAIRAYPHAGGLTVYLQDFSQRKEIEERLRQSQKMDSLGQLTGGIAHDFNNLLTVILGNIDLLQDYLRDAPESVRGQADVIRMAGDRAAELTHRLLAFARRQPLNPQSTNVNELVLEAQQLLARTMGEDIQIELVRGSGLWPATVDPHELQNAILNLALNARDAMTAGGRLTIETANMSVDQDYADLHGIKAGSYIMVAVSDTGCGMAQEIADSAFDPFFTTKEEGKGSGLGLAMVYGFAHQSGGHVKIYSEPGEGTTVRLYLPRALTPLAEPYQALAKPPGLIGGSERVLLVEDNELVRLYTVNTLHQLGYQVTEFAEGKQAVNTLQQGQRFDLLLTDVVLAGGMSGKEVAQAAAGLDPDMKILYMSGYAENAIVHHGRLDPGVHLLSKPFRSSELARKLRVVLDG